MGLKAHIRHGLASSQDDRTDGNAAALTALSELAMGQ